MHRTPLPPTIGQPATRALHANGITCLEDVAKFSPDELMKFHGVGPKAIAILRQALSENNLHFAE